MKQCEYCYENKKTETYYDDSAKIIAECCEECMQKDFQKELDEYRIAKGSENIKNDEKLATVEEVLEWLGLNEKDEK